MSENHKDRVVETLREVYARRGQSRLFQEGSAALDASGVEWKNPLTEMMEAEEAQEQAMREQCGGMTQRMADGLMARLPEGELRDRLLEYISKAAQQIAFEAFEKLESQWMQWIFEKGPEPLGVLQRVFALCKQQRPDLLWNMSFRDLGKLLSERHATAHARLKRLFDGSPAGWKKGKAAREQMAKAQQKNANRRNGKRTKRKKKNL